VGFFFKEADSVLIENFNLILIPDVDSRFIFPIINIIITDSRLKFFLFFVLTQFFNSPNCAHMIIQYLGYIWVLITLRVSG